MVSSRTTWFFIVVSFIALVSASGADDLIAAVAKGDADTVLQQVGHGTPANDANSKGQLALVLAGTDILDVYTRWTQHEMCCRLLV